MKKILFLSTFLAGVTAVYSQGTIQLSSYNASCSVLVFAPQSANPTYQLFGASPYDIHPGATAYTGQPLGGGNSGSGPTAYGNGASWTVAIYAAPGENNFTGLAAAEAGGTADAVLTSQFLTSGGTGFANAGTNGNDTAGMWSAYYFQNNSVKLGASGIYAGQFTGGATIQIQVWYSGSGLTYSQAVAANEPAGVSAIGELPTLGGGMTAAPNLNQAGITSFSLAYSGDLGEEGEAAGYYFTINPDSNTITLTTYFGPAGAVTIPTQLEGWLVTAIGSEAFDQDNYSPSVTSITIPNSVTTLQNAAFQQAYNLGTISIGSGVTNIGSQNVFLVCFGLTNITVDPLNPQYSSSNGVLFNKNQSVLLQYPIGSKAAEYIIPDGVTAIGEDSFEYAGASIYGGGSLTTVVIPGSVTNIAENAFGACFLSSVFFSGNAPEVDPTAFGNNGEICYYLPGTRGWTDFAATTGVPTVLWNPLIQSSSPSFGFISNQFGFIITAATNLPVAVEASTNLTSPVWTPLTNVTLTNGSFYFTDPQWTNYATRFYGLGFP